MRCLLASALIGLVCLPAVGGLIARAMLAVPPTETRADEAANAALLADPAMRANRAWWLSMHRGRVTEEQAANAAAHQPGNILPTYASLLIRLRAPTASGPAEGEKIDEVCSRILQGQPLRLGTLESRKLVADALQRGGRSPRMAWAMAEQLRWSYEVHRPVLRELADRLAALDSPSAHQVVVRMLTDVLIDSPTHDLASLAGPRLCRSLRALGRDEEAARIETQLMPALRNAEAPGIIPFWLGPLLCPGPHWHNVKLTLAGGLIILAVILLMLSAGWTLLAMWIARQRGAPQTDLPETVRGLWLAAAVVAAGPLLMLVGLLASPHAALPWLCSERSLTGMLLLPGGLLLSLQIAARAVDGGSGRSWIRRVGLPLGIAVVLAVAVCFLVPVYPEPWRPPADVQLFRRAGFFAGWLWLVEALVLAVTGWRGRRRRGQARLGRHLSLALTSRALLLVMLALAPVLLWGARADGAHQRAFLAAVETRFDADGRLSAVVSDLRRP